MGEGVHVSVFLMARSEFKRCRAKKLVRFHSLPRVGESIEFEGYYAYPFVVREVTHSCEEGAPAIRVFLSDHEGQLQTVSDADIDLITQTLQEQGWDVT